MKKFILIILALCLLCLVGCSGEDERTLSGWCIYEIKANYTDDIEIFVLEIEEIYSGNLEKYNEDFPNTKAFYITICDDYGYKNEYVCLIAYRHGDFDFMFKIPHYSAEQIGYIDCVKIEEEK